MQNEICPHCAAGHQATKMKRNWIHHDPKTGRLIVCVAHELKPSA